MKKQGGAYARTKGHQFEREVVKKLRPIFRDVERVKCGDSLDLNGVDIRSTGSLRIQCKRNKKYAPIGKIEEVKCDDGIPILWTKGDFKRPVVCMYEDDFLKIIQDIGEVYDQGYKKPEDVITI